MALLRQTQRDGWIIRPRTRVLARGTWLLPAPFPLSGTSQIVAIWFPYQLNGRSTWSPGSITSDRLDERKIGAMDTTTLVIVLLVLLLLFGGGGGYYGRRAGWRGPQYGGSLLGLILLILLVLWLTGNLGSGRRLGPRVQVDLFDDQRA
jgi:hypothetical protein